MSKVSRFPVTPPQSGILGIPDESAQIITLWPSTGVPTTFNRGGANMTSIAAWKLAEAGLATPFSDIVLQFTSNIAPFTLGNGTTDRIGLYAGGGGGSTNRLLLGILGINLGGATPQVPFVTNSFNPAELAGFAQVICNVAQFSSLGIGGVTADILTGGPLVTVTARPIRKRDYAG